MRHLILACLCLFWATMAAAQTRHAFVVGIDTYDNVASLAKARNDARAVAGALEEAGFRTQLLIDADETALLTELTRFSGQLDPGDEVVFYFAGHGVEINGQNYLLPADVPSVAPGQELVVTRGALPVSDVIDQFNSRGVRLSLLILDACRDNPFETLGTRSLGRSVGLGREEAPEGTFVMFSAGAGQQALDRLSTDDPNPNSVFTRVLLPRLTEPGLPLRTMVREVRSEVRALGRTVAHEQFPAVYDQLDGAFTFVPGEAAPEVAVAVPEVTPQPSPTAAADPCAAARADWSLIGENPSVSLLEAYTSAHSGCPLMLALASERLAAMSTAAAPTPSPAPTTQPQTPVQPTTSRAASQLVEACVAAAHPDSVAWADMQEASVQSNAERACESALEAIGDPNSADYLHVSALLGRVEHARGNYSVAHELYRVAAEAGDGFAAYNFGSLYEYGEGVAVNGDHAGRWYRRAGEYGRAAGWYRYAFIYSRGEIVPQNYDIAVEGFLTSADQGYAPAMYELGRMYRAGNGLVQSDQLAAQWFERGAEVGHAASMTNAGFMYERGRGVRQSYSEAARYYQMAADAGHADGTARLGVLYLDGDGVPRDPEGAYILFNRAADGGSSLAMRTLGFMLRDGDGVPQDESAAADWFRMATDQGDASAATQLAFLYFRGRGVPADVAEAERLYRMGAEGGNLLAMRSLGNFLRDGVAGNRDQVEAMRWFMEAAEGGDAFANYFVGWQHEYGRGVPVNLPEAARWHMRGLAAGDDYAIRNPDEFDGPVGREMQILLRNAGHYDGAIDGAVGPGTISAMQAYLDAN
ncbi:MAG: hypothetical protein Gyms2KO_11140 [Gymnodinialimonas sp.]